MTEKYRNSAMAEVALAGEGYEIQQRAFERLGSEFRAQFNALTTSGQIRQFVEDHRDILEPEEVKEFLHYADFIGCVMGFQDEIE